MRKTILLLVLGGTVAAVSEDATRRHRRPGEAVRARNPAGKEVFTGVGSAIHFYYPTGVAVDAAGTVYVADQGTHTIRKVSPTGKISTLAGEAGLQNVDSLTIDGPGAMVWFSNPTGVAVDASGTVYVADTGTQLIRKITPAGMVSTLAGHWDKEGNNDGFGKAAHFKGPCGIAVDAAGTVYVADTGNDCIRKISPAGLVSTLAGSGRGHYADGSGAAATFDGPTGVAVDAIGNVYVADTGNHRICKISPAGTVSTVAGATPPSSYSPEFEIGSYVNGRGLEARFYRPTGVAVDATGTVFVLDSENFAIRKISPDGEVSTLAGITETAAAKEAAASLNRRMAKRPGKVHHKTHAFHEPFGLAVDKNGMVYVADTGNHRIRTISPAGTIRTLAGDGPGENEPVMHRHLD